jgi:hypothetical protein
MSEGQQRRPSARDCETALKILTAFERLVNDSGKHFGSRRLAELREKRAAGTITIDDLPGRFRRRWTAGEFDGKNLNEIRRMCGRQR